MNPKRHFSLKKPCANCPFLRVGAIDLAPGRLADIVQSLLADDHEHFLCHKTVHSKHGGDWNDDDGSYTASGNEAGCMGAMIYLAKIGRPNLPMRLGHAFGLCDIRALAQRADQVIDPADLTPDEPGAA